jgi:hypothetical protein
LKLAKSNAYNKGGAVRYRVRETSEGKPAVVALAVDYEQAPVPDHYYVADYYQVLRQGMDVLLIFGKLDHPNLDRLRNKIEVYFPAQLFVLQLWKSSRDFQKTLAEYVEKSHARAVEPGIFAPTTEKVQTLHANNALMVLSGGHCIIDLFYISAKDLWLKPAKGEALGIEALVRIICSGSFVLGLLQECDRVAQDIIEDLQINIEEVDEDAIVESK